MTSNQEKVAIGDLKPGMYVARLDRPWLDTPYKVQGGLIKSEKDIEGLAKYCEFVYIDIEKSNNPDEGVTLAEPAKTLSNDEQIRILTNSIPRQYEYKSRFREELKTAYQEHAALRSTIKTLLSKTANNNHVDLPTVEKAVMPMVESVMRNPDAFAWLTMMQKRDGYAYNHSLSAAIWAAAFGRNLGLPIKQIQQVSMGALLFDIGKVKLPEKLISNPNLYNAVEYNLVKKHVDYSMEIVNSIDGISEDIKNMIATHHERHDGSGYPNGLQGNSIPLFGKMAGIIDCYDAITSERLHAAAISPHDAVKKLYNWSGSDFQPELIEQFIQVVGVYPVGTLVELSDGRIGVVVSHNKARRLRPRVMILLNKNKQFYSHFQTINLSKLKEDEDGQPLNIIKAVKPGFYGIDPGQFFL
jgi:HD-GYP domain-containing protein (c-di-GMP phosphodiesterase class II)